MGVAPLIQGVTFASVAAAIMIVNAMISIMIYGMDIVKLVSLHLGRHHFSVVDSLLPHL